jgi:hypothetical protein
LFPQVPLLLLSLASGLKQINYTLPGSARRKESVREKLGRIDFIGCFAVFVSMGAFLTLLSAKNNDNLPVRASSANRRKQSTKLTFSSTQWNHPLVISACVIAPIFLVIFLYNEAYWAKEPSKFTSFPFPPFRPFLSLFPFIVSRHNRSPPSLPSSALILPSHPILPC